jgi:hypothetical protein
LTCLAWEAIPVVMLLPAQLSGSFDHTSPNQTVEHIIYDCGKLNNERRKLITNISKEDHWPVGKNVLVNKYLKQITHFINSIDYGYM